MIAHDILNCSVPAVSSLPKSHQHIRPCMLEQGRANISKIHCRPCTNQVKISQSTFPILSTRQTYINLYLFPVRIFNRGIITLNPDILDELRWSFDYNKSVSPSFPSSFGRGGGRCIFTGKTAFPNTACVDDQHRHKTKGERAQEEQYQHPVRRCDIPVCWYEIQSLANGGKQGGIAKNAQRQGGFFFCPNGHYSLMPHFVLDHV